MKNSWTRSTLYASLALSLLISPSLLSETAPHKKDHFYTLGESLGKDVVKMSQNNGELPQKNSLMDNKELMNMNQALTSAPPSSDEHKKAFKNAQSLFRGLKEALEDVKVVSGNDLEAQQKAFAIKMNRAMADAFINAENYADAMKEMGTALSKLSQEAQICGVHQPIQFTLDTNDPFYKEGLSVAKALCNFMTRQAQGEDIAPEEGIALTKKVNERIFAKKPNATQEDLQQNVLQLLTGMAQAFKEYNLEEVLKTHHTAPKIADKLRLTYKTSLQSLISGIEGMTAPAQGLDKLGKTLQNHGTELKKLEQQ